MSKAKGVESVGSKMLVDLPLKQLHQDPDQSRGDPMKQKEPFGALVRSIKHNGVLVPLIVIPNGEGEFTIKAGHRRFAAAIEAKLKSVPCLIRKKKGERHVGAVENLLREPLSQMEEARMFQALLKAKEYPNQRALAKAIGIHESRITGKLKLLKLDTDLQDAVEKGKLPGTTAEKASGSKAAQDKIRAALKGGTKPKARDVLPSAPQRMKLPESEVATGMEVFVYEDRTLIQFEIQGKPGTPSWDAHGTIRDTLSRVVKPDDLKAAVRRVRAQLAEKAEEAAKAKRSAVAKKKSKKTAPKKKAAAKKRSGKGSN